MKEELERALGALVVELDNRPYELSLSLHFGPTTIEWANPLHNIGCLT
jgi:hypothetical protein